MRYFSQNSEIHCFRRDIDYFKGNIYDLMARRIQRAWRRFRTYKLVTRYANIFVNFDMSDRSNSLSRKEYSSESREEIMIESDQLYPEEMEQRKVTYISNL